MQNEKAIWIVDDDIDDHELIREIFKELNLSYPLELFDRAEQLLEKLDQVETAPFIIICDVNMPKMGGFALREEMLKIPNNKFHSVPFIFWSTEASEAQIKQAYDLRGNGFFRKEESYEQWKQSLVKIINYWIASLVPTREDKYDHNLLA